MINKNVTIGMLISGLISYFEKEEKRDDAALVHIEQRLEKKLSSFRYGTPSFREKVKIAHAKKKKNKKDKELLLRLGSYNDRYKIHSKFAANIWKKLLPLVKDDQFSINYLIIALLQREPATKDYFAFKDEAILAFGGAKSDTHGYAFSSLRVANKILSLIEQERELLENTQA